MGLPSAARSTITQVAASGFSNLSCGGARLRVWRREFVTWLRWAALAVFGMAMGLYDRLRTLRALWPRRVRTDTGALDRGFASTGRMAVIGFLDAQFGWTCGVP